MSSKALPTDTLSHSLCCSVSSSLSVRGSHFSRPHWMTLLVEISWTDLEGGREVTDTTVFYKDIAFIC